MKYAKKLPNSLTARLRETPVPWGPLGFVTYKRTYSRLMEAQGRTEEWADTVERCLTGLLDYGMAVTEDELDRMAWHFHQLKIMPAGRGLWQLGTKNVDRIGSAGVMNCYFVALDSVESFCFLFDMLMLGGGVGFSVMPNDVFKLPNVRPGVTVTRKDAPDVDFIVPDNREGWVELLRRTLTSFFVTGRSFTYSCHCVRSKGAPIVGFGGTASGPEEFAKGIDQIAHVLTRRANKALRPIDALDVANVIASIVVAGNVRRSAQIAVGYAQDAQYLNAKRWDLGTIPNWRAMSNNTVSVGDVDELPDSFWAGYEGNGEPYGLFNLDLSRSSGRLADGGLYPDHGVQGVNPCAEQTLEADECCCLVEEVLPNLKDRGEFHEASELVYKMAKTMISIPHHWAKANAVMERNRRIGIGVTGICQQSRFGPADYDAVYGHLREVDGKYSAVVGLNRSIKMTTCKPSGTVSLLPGVTPGIHPGYAPHYIRRIRIGADDPLVAVSRSHGYHVEPVLRFDGSPDPNTSVVEFPVALPKGARVADDMSAVDQMELQESIQRHWSDNAVSITVYYRKEELPEIRERLKSRFKGNVKTISFLLHQDHGFKQAPYEAIGRKKYLELSAATRPITSLTESQERDLLDSQECTTGVCPVK